MYYDWQDGWDGELTGVTTAGRVYMICQEYHADQNIKVNLVTFKVSKLWKGTPAQFITVTTGLNEAGCGYAFKIGRRYLVYADIGNGEAYPRTSICTPTKPLGEATADVAILGPPTFGANPLFNLFAIDTPLALGLFYWRRRQSKPSSGTL